MDKFKEFKAESKKQLGRHIKSLRFDQGGEYMFIEFIYFLKEHGILSQLSASGTPQKKWSGRKNKSNSVRHGKVNDESFHIIFILLVICLRDTSLHFEYGVIQVSTKDTRGKVDRS